MINYDFKRVTIVCGHYGSGKTNVALNIAYNLKKMYEKVAIADIDIVNPYFRTKDSEQILKDNDIKLICSNYASTNIDVPSLPQEMFAVTHDPSAHYVVDVGGDERGALALGRLASDIKEENDYEMIFVFNKYRPLTSDLEKAMVVFNEIESAVGLKFTAIINNSNLAELTDAGTVLDSRACADALSKFTGLPIKFTSVKTNIAKTLCDKIENIYPLILQSKL